MDDFNNKHFYFPDFEVEGKLIEIKGPHFLNEDGTLKLHPCTKKNKEFKQQVLNHKQQLMNSLNVKIISDKKKGGKPRH